MQQRHAPVTRHEHMANCPGALLPRNPEKPPLCRIAHRSIFNQPLLPNFAVALRRERSALRDGIALVGQSITLIGIHPQWSVCHVRRSLARSRHQTHPARLRMAVVSLHLKTCSADQVVQIACIAHRRYDWWIECDVRNSQGTLLRGCCLHPALIVPDENEPSAVDEYKRLQQAVQHYLHIHGRWINSRWEPHDKSNSCGSPPKHNSRAARNRRHFRRRR